MKSVVPVVVILFQLIMSNTVESSVTRDVFPLYSTTSIEANTP